MLKRARKTIDEDLKDLGFGSRVTRETRFRLLNRDGSFNVSRQGFSFPESLELYHSFLNLSWLNFHLTLLSFFLVINAFDETLSQTVHARSSYEPNEIAWRAQFKDIFQYSGDGLVGIALRCLHQIEEAAST